MRRVGPNAMGTSVVVIGTLALLGLSGSGTAQIPTTGAIQNPSTRSSGAVLSPDRTRLTVSPELALQPRPDQTIVSVDVSDGGSVRFLGVTCSVATSASHRSCSHVAPRHSFSMLTAEPLPGYLFAGWSGGCQAANAKKSCSLPVGNEPVAASARFLKAAGPMTTLKIEYGYFALQGMRVTLTPDKGLDCVRDAAGNSSATVSYHCTAEIEQGTTVAISAEDVFGPSSPINPNRWGGACAGTITTVCTLTMGQDRSVLIQYPAGS